MIHPTYETLIRNGIEPEYVGDEPVLLVASLVERLNEEAEDGMIAYSDWTTVRIFFDAQHVCNIVLDERGITFEYTEGGQMISDSRSNKVVFAVIRVLGDQKKPC